MTQSKHLSEKSFFLSHSEVDKSEIFSVNEVSYVTTINFFYLLIKKIFKITNSAKIIINYYHASHDYLDNENFLKDCVNIKDIKPLMIINSYPPIFGIRVTYKEKDLLRTGRGVSFVNSREAFQKAFGEYLERFHGFFVSNDDFNIRKQPKIYPFSLSRSSFKLSQVSRPLISQKIYQNFPKTDIDLVGMRSHKVYNTSKSAWELLPISCLYYGVQDEKFLHHPTSSGAGGGVSLENARISAVYELIERDSFLLHWVSGVQPKKIKIETLPEVFSRYISGILQRYKLEAYILNTSMDINFFSCIVVVIDPIFHRVCLGGGAGTNVLKSIESAFSESIAELHASEGISNPRHLTYDTLEPFSDESIDKNVRKNFFNTESGVIFFKKIFLRGVEIDFESVNSVFLKKFKNPKEELKHIVDFFKNESQKFGDGYNLYFFEYDSKLLKKYDYSVSKAYVPCFIKLWLNENLASPWSNRLVAFAKRNGKNDFSEKDLNFYPHPLS